ncbi:YheC/YheD family protein [Bacillus sp. DJP31]|uniref:YheC/YheD family endospore coat-associated protein n=1 Tax=Bacillus sp. DJP31 TaxID=3409789 RepID=UPI003BB5FBE9
MTTIGMLHFRKHPSTVIKAYAYAAAAKMEGIEFFYFSFGKVNTESKKIEGYKYENGSWILGTFSYPDVIYNAGGADSELQSEVDRLLREWVPFTSFSIGNKMSVYKRIKKGKDFLHYLIPTESVSALRTITKFFERYDKIVMKPVSGRKGENIVLFEKLTSQEYRILVRRKEIFLNAKQFGQYVMDLLLINKWVVQPYIKSVTKDGNPFDFRLHVQKDGFGEWVITSIYPRVTVKGIVSNISSGGYTNIVEDFLRIEYDDDYFNMKRYLEHFALSFATHFDKLYEKPLDELGIDVGIDENRKAWIYEVNWRPGTPPTYSLELDVARNMIQYAVFLAGVKTNEK